jgi:SAM-dependent methyltransferase
MSQLITKTETVGRQQTVPSDSPPSDELSRGPLPPWAGLVRSQDKRWAWKDGQFVHRERREAEIASKQAGILQKLLVKHVYAAQNNSQKVRKCIDSLLSELKPAGWALNLGSGDADYHPRMINLDIQDSEHVDILTTGTQLPFQDQSLDLVISQAVLEHIDSPLDTIAEVHRVLRPGGKFYCQVPFVIGFHPGPFDYWRFTRQALEHLFTNENWELKTLDLSLGHGSGFYRVLVEFLAVTASTISQRLYRPAKGLAAIICMPLQWLDILTPLSEEKDRIPGGYFCVAVKH